MKKFTLLMTLCIASLLLVASPTKVHAQDEYTAVAETPPAPVGGDAAVYKNIDYPDMARKAKLKGKVYVLVLINEKGGVDKATVIKGIGLGCDDAAITGIKKSKFTPGKSGGVAVKAKLTMAINF
jgi:periplasmic protein TonB